MVANPRPAEFTGLQTEIVTVVPDLAQHWLATCAFEDQRAVNWHKVEALALALVAGRFHAGTITFGRAVGDPAGQWWLIDGQHRLNVVVRAQTAATFCVLRQTFANRSEMRAAYARIDPPGGGRSIKDALKAHDIAGRTALTATQARSVSAAGLFLAGGFQAQTGAGAGYWLPDDRAATVEAWAEVASDFFAQIEGAPAVAGKKLQTVGILAVGLVTMRYCRHRAATFWQAVAANDGLLKGTPEHVMVNQVMQTGAARVQPHGMARLAAACWNAAHEGRGLSLAKVYNPNAPIVLRGTPLNGKRVFTFPPGSIDEVEVTA